MAMRGIAVRDNQQEIATIANWQTSGETPREGRIVEWKIVKQIIEDSQAKLEHERLVNHIHANHSSINNSNSAKLKNQNDSSQLTSMRILSSYSNVLAQNNIDATRDIDYYRFFMQVTRFMQQTNFSDWMLAASHVYELSKSQQDQQDLQFTHQYQSQPVQQQFQQQPNELFHLQNENLNLEYKQIPLENQTLKQVQQVQQQNVAATSSLTRTKRTISELNNVNSFRKDSFEYHQQMPFRQITPKQQSSSSQLAQKVPCQQVPLNSNRTHSSSSRNASALPPTPTGMNSALGKNSTSRTSKRILPPSTSRQKELLNHIQENLMSLEKRISGIETEYAASNQVKAFLEEGESHSTKHQSASLQQYQQQSHQNRSQKLLSQQRSHVTSTSQLQPTQEHSMKQLPQRFETFTSHENNNNININNNSGMNSRNQIRANSNLKNSQVSAFNENGMGTSSAAGIERITPQSQQKARRQSRNEMLDDIAIDPAILELASKRSNSPPFKEALEFGDKVNPNGHMLAFVDNFQTQGSQQLQQKQQEQQQQQQQVRKVLQFQGSDENESRYRKVSSSRNSNNNNNNIIAQSIYQSVPESSFQNQITTQSNYRSTLGPIGPEPTFENILPFDQHVLQKGQQRKSSAGSLHRGYSFDGMSAQQSVIIPYSLGIQSQSSTRTMKHSVSFGGMNKDQNSESALLLKSQCFTKWISFVCLERDHRVKVENNRRKMASAADYHSMRTKHKVIVLLRGFSALARDRNAATHELTQKTNFKLKSKYMQLFCIKYNLSQVEKQQIGIAEKYASTQLKRRGLLGFVHYYSRTKRILASLDSLALPNRAAIQFLIGLAVSCGIQSKQISTQSSLQLMNVSSQLKTLEIQVAGFQHEKAIAIACKQRAALSTTKLRVDYMLRPHLEFLRRDMKRRVFERLMQHALEAIRARIEYKQKLKRIAFIAFKEKWQHRVVVQKHFNEKFSRMLSNILQQWREITVSKREFRLKIVYLKRQSKFNLVAGMFSNWHSRFHNAQIAKEEKQRGRQIREYLVQRKVFAGLRMFVEQRISSHARNVAVFEKYFERLLRKTFQGLREISKKLRIENTLVEQFNLYVAERSSKTLFTAWRRATINSKIVQQFREFRLKSKSIESCKISLIRRREIEANIEQFKQNKAIFVKSACFFSLKENHAQNTIKQSHADSFYQIKLITNTFNRFCQLKESREIKENAAIQFHDQKQLYLSARCLQLWRARRQTKQIRKQQQKIAEATRGSHLLSRSLECLKYNFQQESKAKQIRNKIRVKSLKECLEQWRNNAARKRHESYLQNLSFRVFRSYAWKKTQLKRKISSHRSLRNSAILSSCFSALHANKQKNECKRAVNASITSNRATRTKQNVLLAWREYHSAQISLLSRCFEISRQATLNLKKEQLASWRSINRQTTLKIQALEFLLQNHQQKSMRAALYKWTQVAVELAVEEEQNTKADAFWNFSASSKAMISLRANVEFQARVKAQESKADHFFKRVLFQSFLNGFYTSIQEKKLKHISIKHYAIQVCIHIIFRLELQNILICYFEQLLQRSFSGWAKQQKQQLEGQCFRVFDSTSALKDQQQQQQQQHPESVPNSFRRAKLFETINFSEGSVKSNAAAAAFEQDEQGEEEEGRFSDDKRNSSSSRNSLSTYSHHPLSTSPPALEFSCNQYDTIQQQEFTPNKEIGIVPTLLVVVDQEREEDSNCFEQEGKQSGETDEKELLELSPEILHLPFSPN